MSEDLQHDICEKLDELIQLMEDAGFNTITQSGGPGFVGVVRGAVAGTFKKAWKEVERGSFTYNDTNYLPTDLPPLSLVTKTVRPDGSMAYSLGDDAGWWINFVSPEEAQIELCRLRRQIAVLLSLYRDAEARSRLVGTLENELKEGFAKNNGDCRK